MKSDTITPYSRLQNKLYDIKLVIDKIDRIGENAILSVLKRINNSDKPYDESGFFRKHWKGISVGVVGGTLTALAMYGLAAYAGGWNNPGLGYSIYRVGGIDSIYSLVPNPLLHPDLVRTQGLEIIKNSAAELTSMVKESAIRHLPYDFIISYAGWFLGEMGAKKLSKYLKGIK